MKVISRYYIDNREEAFDRAESLIEETGKIVIVFSNFDVLVIEEHTCSCCDFDYEVL